VHSPEFLAEFGNLKQPVPGFEATGGSCMAPRPPFSGCPRRRTHLQLQSGWLCHGEGENDGPMWAIGPGSVRDCAARAHDWLAGSRALNTPSPNRFSPILCLPSIPK
jgi:hypothetical protein